MTRMETERHARTRGLILKILAPHHPNSLDREMVRFALDDFGQSIDERLMDSYLEYLKECECVVVDKGRQGIALVRITNRGLNLLDGYTSDPGINVKGL